jgi:hypothetical protein
VIWKRLIPLPAALLGLCACLVTPVHAAVSPIPASAYPPHTRITYFPNWTNGEFDCNFGWVCSSGSPQPYMHMSTEDQLHRTSGWATWGEWHGDTLGFELYASVYDPGIGHDGLTWNQIAASDENAMLVRGQGARSETVPSLLPDGVQGGAFAYSMNRPYWHVLFLTVWWGGNSEIEAAAVYPLKKKSEAHRYLIKQVRAAVRVAQTGA